MYFSPLPLNRTGLEGAILVYLWARMVFCEWYFFLQCNIKTQVVSAGSEMMFDVTHVVIGMDYRDLNEMVG